MALGGLKVIYHLAYRQLYSIFGHRRTYNFTRRTALPLFLAFFSSVVVCECENNQNGKTVSTYMPQTLSPTSTQTRPYFMFRIRKIFPSNILSQTHTLRLSSEMRNWYLVGFRLYTCKIHENLPQPQFTVYLYYVDVVEHHI